MGNSNSRFVLAVAALLLAFGLAPGAGAASQDPATGDRSSAQAGETGLSKDDRNFIMDAAHGNQMEIDMARMALERASSADVKQFAQKMIDDHTKAGEELKQVASSKGVSLDAHMAMDGKMKDKMMKFSGADFDREYMKMQEKEHGKMAKMFERESTRGRDADVKAFAAKTLPTVRSHWEMARDWNAKAKGMAKEATAATP